MSGVRPVTLDCRVVIPTGKCKSQNPGLAGIYRALAEHERRQKFPDAVEAARADFVALTIDA